MPAYGLLKMCVFDVLLGYENCQWHVLNSHTRGADRDAELSRNKDPSACLVENGVHMTASHKTNGT